MKNYSKSLSLKSTSKDRLIPFLSDNRLIRRNFYNFFCSKPKNEFKREEVSVNTARITNTNSFVISIRAYHSKIFKRFIKFSTEKSAEVCSAFLSLHEEYQSPSWRLNTHADQKLQSWQRDFKIYRKICILTKHKHFAKLSKTSIGYPIAIKYRKG